MFFFINNIIKLFKNIKCNDVLEQVYVECIDTDKYVHLVGLKVGLKVSFTYLCT